jgi:2-O-sulfo trehalose long-chain-acyltransferase
LVRLQGCQKHRPAIANPRDIEFVPIEHGQMTPTEWRELVLATPDPLQWDCFRFGSIQHADHFTLFVIIDHLHTDPALITGLYVEILTMYRALVSGAPPISLPPTASHDDFCVRESQYAAAVSLDSPEVRKWIEFAENNGGDTVVERLMDQDQTAQFESRCAAAGTRFSGGLFACAALTQYELTGLETYYGLTPIDKRRTPAEYVTMGWFTGIVPFTVPVDPTSFEETARATQASFDSNADLANVPYDRVLELAPWLRRYGPNFTMLNYMDAGLPPLSAVAASALEGATATAYNDGRSPAYLYMSVIRLFDEVSLMVSFPNNPIARESVTRYMETMKSVFGRVAEGRDAVASLTDAANA